MTTTSDAYDTAKTTADTGSDALALVTANKLATLNAKILEVANFNALYQALVTQYAKQEIELAKETLVYDLASDAKDA